jgi:hypothetical protein
MFKKTAILIALVAAAGTALALDLQNVARSIALKDGTTVYIFKDGKMAMADKNGRTVGMKAGHVMETADGQRIIMVGNELARLERINADHRGGPSN